MAVTERVTVELLTKDQLKALRAANDCVILRHLEDEEYVGTITAVVRELLHGQAVEARVTFGVNSAITNYEEGRASDTPASEEDLARLKLRADYMVNYPHEDGGRWRTIARMLREGDQIQLHWIRGNHNALTRELGLAVDELRLEILRDRKSVASFMVAYSVGHRNCARMVRSAREQNTYL